MRHLLVGSAPRAGLAAYDGRVPGPTRQDRLAARFARLRGLRGADPAGLGRVRDVVLLVSSSRGGSTLLAELLRRSPELLAIPGETNPYVAVAQLSAGRCRREVLSAELAAEIGSPASRLDVDELVLFCLWRFAAQWPAVDLPDRVVHEAVVCPDPPPAPAAAVT